MAKELTFSAATLGWRFAHTEIFLRNFVKQWELLQDVGFKNLDEYWNINAATGDWLKQIGLVFDVERPQMLGNDAFMLDVDKMDYSDRILDGTMQDMEDSLFRKIILLHTATVKKLFSIPNLVYNLYQVFGENQIRINILENIDTFGNHKDRYFQLKIYFRDLETLKLCRFLQDTLPLALIGKPMGVSYDVFCEYDIGAAVFDNGGVDVENLAASFDGTEESILPWRNYIVPYDNGSQRVFYIKMPLDESGATQNCYADMQLTQVIGTYARKQTEKGRVNDVVWEVAQFALSDFQYDFMGAIVAKPIS